VGFAFSFIRQELWPYLIVLPLYLIAMVTIAPSKRNIERRQETGQSARVDHVSGPGAEFATRTTGRLIHDSLCDHVER
jgi:hypothetical protein